MSPLEPEEKAAGRFFRDVMAEDLRCTFDDDPPTYTVPHFLGLYRHTCPAKHRSMAIELKEHYVPSGEIVVETDDDGRHTAVWFEEWSPYRAGQVDTWRVPSGRFGFIYRGGTCRACGQTARSRTGRLVDGWERPPIEGRVTRS